MATTKPPYDPVKTVEGMFNGSVTRIAYAMKDPLNYAQSTRAVLAEAAKKFQDALDDCEIQILDAKWYLENQLAQNRARREAKAREDSAASAKRKRQESTSQDKAGGGEIENAPKRVKTEEPENSLHAQAPAPAQAQSQPAPKSSSQQPLPQPVAPPANAIPPTPVAPSEQPTPPKPLVKPEVPVVAAVESTQRASAPGPKAPEKPPESTIPQPIAEDMPKMTPQETPAGGNEDFNFVSMFGEPSGDMMDGAENNMNFNLGLGDGLDADASGLSVQDSSLNSLLPGLESYANQAEDDNAFNMPANTALNINSPGGLDMGLGGTALNNPTQQPISVNDFSLPALGPNEFDAFLDADDMTFDENINLNGDGNMANLDNMDNMDFDSMFS